MELAVVWTSVPLGSGGVTWVLFRSLKAEIFTLTCASANAVLGGWASGSTPGWEDLVTGSHLPVSGDQRCSLPPIEVSLQIVGSATWPVCSG